MATSDTQLVGTVAPFSSTEQSIKCLRFIDFITPKIDTTKNIIICIMYKNVLGS